MAKDINEYHTCLQEKIAAATRELTEKNEALARASRSKSDFIAKTSHELRTPLTAIKGAMDYLSVKLSMRESEEDQDLLVFFEMIKKNADRLIRIVNSVLEYERIELGAIEMNFREVNLKEVFQEVIAGFRPLADEKGVGLRLHAMDVAATVDDDRMKQVLTNLLSNALHFSPEGSSISVSLTCRDEYVHASVEDRGSGIPEQDRDLIFRQFYTKDTSGGTGLGLAICKGIIEAHNGEIGVEDGSTGGSLFWFRIPKARAEKVVNEKTTACDR
jgi:signal transduction histidine kinase